MLERGRFLVEYQEKFAEENLSVTRFGLPVDEKSILGFYPPLLSPTHRGNFLTAVDIAVPDPRHVETIVYAPCDGVVCSGILTNKHWGKEKADESYQNWLNIGLEEEGEFLELIHISGIASNILYPGLEIKKGEAIARVALNGRITMTDDKPDAHLHMYVGKWIGVGKFVPRRINWDFT